MIGVVASLTVVSLAAAPAVRRVRSDRTAWVVCGVGTAAGLTAGVLGLTVGWTS